MQAQQVTLEKEPEADSYALPVLHAACVEAVSEWMTHARNMPLARQAVLYNPTLSFDLRGLSAGMAVISRKDPGACRIRINEDLLRRYPQETLQQTVPHEVAHIVAYQLFGKLNHGREWRLIMEAFGKPATRCHQMQAVAARQHRKYVYRCACAEHQVGARINARIKRGQRYTCRQCATALRAVRER